MTKLIFTEIGFLQRQKKAAFQAAFSAELNMLNKK